MSYLIFVCIMLISFTFFCKKKENAKNIAVFIEDKDIRHIEKRKVKQVMRLGIPIYFISRRKTENAIKAAKCLGIMNRGASFVTGRELKLISKDEYDKLVSFCRLYLECSDISLIKKSISKKYDLLGIEDVDIKKMHFISIRQMVFEFIFLVSAAFITAMTTHYILHCFLT